MERKLNVTELESCLNNVLREVTALREKLISVLSGFSLLPDSSVCPHNSYT